MEIPGVGRNVRYVRLRKEVKQSGGRGIDVGDLIVRQRSVCDRIEELHAGAGKISAALRQSRHGGEDVVWITATSAEIVAEDECLHSPLINMGNVERPANGQAKTLLVIARLGFRLSGQRIGFSVERRAAIRVKKRSVRLVHLESPHAAPATAPSPPHYDHCLPSSASSAETRVAAAHHLDISDHAA